MTSATAVERTRGHAPPNRPNMVAIGTIVWLSSELMFFAALFAMYFTIRAVEPTLWDTETQLLNIPFATANTIVLVLSSVTCQLGVFAAERGDVVRLRFWFVITFLMGAFFVGGQIYEYAELVHEGLTISANPYGSVFYVPTGFHAAHVTGGLIAFLFVLGRTFAARRFTHEQATSAIVVSYYWHFVDVVWIALFATIYLIQYARLTSVTSSSASPRRRRRHPLASALLLLLALALTGAAYAVVAPSRSAEAASARTQSIEAGQHLFLANCATCHGPEAQGTSDGPSLVGVGAAAVDFQVGTGRMPMAQPGPQAPVNKVTFSQREIDDLAAFVASLGPGPAVPEESELDLADADVTEGGELFRTNCAMCHNFAGTGGALTQGKYAASLRGVSAKHIWEAMVTGPQAMPVFSDGTMTPEKKRNIIAYLHTLENDPPVAGLTLGSIGPVSEGLVVWVVGIGALICCAVWLGWKSH